jgi:hypothetical protein
MPQTPATPADLEAALTQVEQRLASFGEALRDGDARALDRQAGELQRALAAAVQRFAHAAKRGAVPLALRQRLAAASGHVAAQRESLARATAALDRAIDALLPVDTGAAALTPPPAR